MSAGIGSRAIDSTHLSEADRVRMAAEQALQRQRQRRAVRVVAGRARDVADCRMLLDVLGLDTAIVGEARARRAASADSATGRKPGARRRVRAA